MSNGTEKIDEILASGVVEVRSKHRRVTYRNTEDLMKAKAHLAEQNDGNNVGFDAIKIVTLNPYLD